MLAADHGHHADTPGLLVSVAGECDRMQALFAAAPAQLGQFDAVGIEPRRLAGHMPVVALLDAARPPALEVGSDPAAIPGRWIEIEPVPCVAAFGMFEHATEPPDGGQRRGKASAVVAELVLMRLAC